MRALAVDWDTFEHIRAWGLTVTDCAERMGLNKHSLIRLSTARYGRERQPTRPEVDWSFVHAQRIAGVPWHSIAGTRSFSWMCNEYHRRRARGEFRAFIKPPATPRLFSWQEAD